MIRMHLMDSLDRLAHLFQSPELVMHGDSADDQHAALQFNFTHSLRGQLAIRCINLARLQRAPKGTGESARGGCDDVIERGRVRRKGIA